MASMVFSLRWRRGKTVGIRVAAGLVLAAVPMLDIAQAYDSPTFSKGLWLFQRSTEFVTKHWLLPNARRVKVEQPVVRCVDPTEAMVETFRVVSIGDCRSSYPEKRNNTFVFAKRCDYLGPVKTVISVESQTAFRETNELLVGASPRKDVVVARRIGDCGSTPDLGTVTDLNVVKPEFIEEAASVSQHDTAAAIIDQGHR